MYTKIKTISDEIHMLIGISNVNSEINVTIRLISKWTGIDEQVLGDKIKQNNGYIFILDILPEINTEIGIVVFKSYIDAENYSDWINTFLLTKVLKGE